jgi:hypothetical protein
MKKMYEKPKQQVVFVNVSHLICGSKTDQAGEGNQGSTPDVKSANPNGVRNLWNEEW